MASSSAQTPEDFPALLVGTEELHANVAQELNASDLDGFQGGQLWDHPTRSPTVLPSQFPSSAPTALPTSHPTLSGQEWTIRGTVWYDRNANGIRDSRVRADGFGKDVEFTHGLGGVSLLLVQCDNSTGEKYRPQNGEKLQSFANTRTAGVDARGVSQIVPTYTGNGKNGKFSIHLAHGHGLERYYYVEAQPLQPPFLFTAGICNDREPGWTCKESDKPTKFVANVTGGISSGRSPGCVFVDKHGKVEKLIDFGVMRQGDIQAEVANIAFVMEFESTRRLANILRRAKVIDEQDNGRFATTRYLLGELEKVAIGTVTAEVLAAALDERLADKGFELDSVNPKDVIVSKTSEKSEIAAGGTELAVNMEIMGHYSPPPYLDFDYIVQDSINRDTTKIRRELREYNDNCRDQRSKGWEVDKFDILKSKNGAKRNKVASSTSNSYSTACSSDFFVPDYFETSLKEIGTRDLKDQLKEQENLQYDTGEGFLLLEQWAIAPVSGIAGLIVLLAGVFLFRRALGRRRVDKFPSSDKTKNITNDEMRRFGEAGMDEESVDSAFYTDSDSDVEETEKERRMRQKRKAKANDQSFKGNNKSQRKNGVSRNNFASSMRKSRRKTISMKEERKLLALSQKSNNTKGSISFSSSDEEDVKAKKGRSSSDRHRRRGRDKRKGGDNSRIYEASRLV